MPSVQFAVAAALALAGTCVTALDNGLALTPPMGCESSRGTFYPTHSAPYRSEIKTDTEHHAASGTLAIDSCSIVGVD